MIMLQQLLAAVVFLQNMTLWWADSHPHDMTWPNAAADRCSCLLVVRAGSAISVA